MIRRPWSSAAAFAALTFALAGCTPSLNAVTTPPPSKSADMYHPLFEDDHIHLSKGATIGLDCYDFWWGSPCSGAVMTSDDPKVARVLPAYLKRAPSPWGPPRAEPQRERGFVVIATNPGQTTLHVRSEDGEAVVDVTVE
jgi:hypothetical protein